MFSGMTFHANQMAHLSFYIYACRPYIAVFICVATVSR